MQKNTKIQTQQSTKYILPKYKYNKIQMERNTNRTKCKNTKIQTWQNMEAQNKNCQNANATKYK